MTWKFLLTLVIDVHFILRLKIENRLTH